MDTNANGKTQDMTVREAFAMAAMQGHMALPDDRCFTKKDHEQMTYEEWRAKAIAADAVYWVKTADALIEALNK